MPKRYDKCVKDVSKKISTGKIPKTYMKRGVRKKSNAYAICSRLRAKGKLSKKQRKDIISQVTNIPLKGLKALEFAHLLSIKELGKKKR